MSKQSQPAVAPPKKKKDYAIVGYDGSIALAFFSSAAVAAGAALFVLVIFHKQQLQPTTNAVLFVKFYTNEQGEEQMPGWKNKVFSSSTTARYAPELERIVTLSCHP